MYYIQYILYNTRVLSICVQYVLCVLYICTVCTYVKI